MQYKRFPHMLINHNLCLENWPPKVPTFFEGRKTWNSKDGATKIVTKIYNDGGMSPTPHPIKICVRPFTGGESGVLFRDMPDRYVFVLSVRSGKRSRYLHMLRWFLKTAILHV